jgi:SAM-dependent methyltransferase
MDIKTFRNLITPAGQEALRAAQAASPCEADFLSHFQTLSRIYPPDLARAALEIAILRAEANEKFMLAGKVYLTREAMQQASSYEVSSYRAKRYQPFKRLVDLGCSIGGDTLALAAIAPTYGVDRDPLRLAMAQANMIPFNLGERTSFLQADLYNPLPFSPAPGIALFFDPGRRVNQRRIHSVAEYQPPLNVIQGWLPNFPALGVKISPGVNLAELDSYDAEIEFISLNGELKEAVLWFGPMKTVPRRATLLPLGHTLISSSNYATTNKRLPLSEPRAWIYEPDPAILRAGLVSDIGEQLNAFQLDPDIAYLTADRNLHTSFARAWQIEAWIPFNLKRLRDYLRKRNVGLVTVKKRGSPLEPEELIRALRLSGDGERIIFLTHLLGRPIVIIAYPR